MNLTNFFVRLSLITFLAIGAWNTLQNLDERTQTLLTNYKTFQKTFTERTNLNFHQTITHQNMTPHAECITKAFSWALLGLGAASLLICKGFTFLLGLVYLVQQVVALNFAKFDFATTLDEFRELALCMLVVFVCFMVAFTGGKAACGMKVGCKKVRACGAKGKKATGVNVKGRKNKKRN